MKRSHILPVWLWFLQALTGVALIFYIVIHLIDNAIILFSEELYEDMLHLWHETLPHWFYLLMVFGLVLAFLIHMLNGIRIASKPYKDIDKSWRHLSMMKHSGTTMWYMQVFTGSTIAIFGIWHLIVQHGGAATTTAAQSMMRVTPTIFILYIIFTAALMFHAFNGLRSICIKLGFMTDKVKESILVGFLVLCFIVFFLAGVFSIAKFLPSPDLTQVDSGNHAAVTDIDNTPEPASSPEPIESSVRDILEAGGPVTGESVDE